MKQLFVPKLWKLSRFSINDTDFMTKIESKDENKPKNDFTAHINDEHYSFHEKHFFFHWFRTKSKTNVAYNLACFFVLFKIYSRILCSTCKMHMTTQFEHICGWMSCVCSCERMRICFFITIQVNCIAIGSYEKRTCITLPSFLVR